MTFAKPGGTQSRRGGESRPRLRQSVVSADAPLASGIPFGLLVAFTLTTFLNIPNRVDAIAAIRPTVIFVVILSACLIVNWEVVRSRLQTRESKWLLMIVAYIILSLPFVKWPGSVISKNFELFARSAVFYFFVVAFVDSLARLRLFVLVFVGCQVFRCLEPLSMHIFSGYWGGITYFGGESMARLVGAPADLVNGNGLAFVVVTAFPFVHFWAVQRRTAIRVMTYAILVPALVYTLILTASRSGLIAFGLIVMGLIWYSKRRASWMILLAIAVALVVPRLSDDQRDRYLSIVDHHAKQSATAEGRITAWGTNFEVFSHRPIFGFGVGTSQEAGYNIAGDVHYAHNLYLEVLIELGVVGCILFLGYIFAVFRSARELLKSASSQSTSESASPKPDILAWMPKALLVWIAMCILFSFASFGFSEYEWYLFGGLVVALGREELKAAAGDSPRHSASPWRRNGSARPRQNRGRQVPLDVVR